MQDEIINEENICVLDKESKDFLKSYFSYIKPPKKLKQNIFEKLNLYTPSVTYLKPMAIAASIVFIVGLGMFVPLPFSKLPSLAQIHSNEKVLLKIDDINVISEIYNFNISEEQITQFRTAGFNIVGATKKSIKGNDITNVVFKNNKGEKITVCILPETYTVDMSHIYEREIIGIPISNKWILSKGDQIIDIIDFPNEITIDVFEASPNGTKVELGENKNCKFTYWKKDGKLIAVVSDSYPDLKIIGLTIPLREKA